MLSILLPSEYHILVKNLINLILVLNYLPTIIYTFANNRGVFMKQWGDVQLCGDNIYWYADTAIQNAISFSKNNCDVWFPAQYEIYRTNFLSYASGRVLDFCISHIDYIINYLMAGNYIENFKDLVDMMSWNKSDTIVG